MARGLLRRVPGAKQRAAPKRAASTTKPSKSKTAVQASALDLFNDVEKSDLNFLMRGFQANSSLVPWLASLMRDGILEKTLRLKQVGAQHTELGKKIPEKCRRLKNLPPRYWSLLWLNLWKEPPSEKRADRLTAEENLGLAQWALRLSPDALLPTNHKSSSYEGPLLAVMKARHEALGCRLQKFTTAAFKRGDYGYFTLPEPFIGKVSITGGHTIEVVSTPRAAEATDWQIQEPYNLDAALVSETLQFCQGLLCIARRTMPPADFAAIFAPHDDEFEMPRAADMFPDPKVYDLPEGTGAASCSSSSFAAASPSAASSSASVGGVIVTPVKPRRRLADD